MTKKEQEYAKKIIAHIFTNDENFKKQYLENPPQIVEKLQWQPGEGVISELSKKDLIQLASRYANDNAVILKNILHFELRIEKLLTWLCEEKGIDVQKKFKEDAKRAEEQLEKQTEQLKKALEHPEEK